MLPTENEKWTGTNTEAQSISDYGLSREGLGEQRGYQLSEGSGLVSGRGASWHLHREMARSLGPSPAGRTCVFCVGICNKRASALKSNVSSKASSAPCTPLSTRLFAYSLRPMERIQRITRSLLQTSTSAGNEFGKEPQKAVLPSCSCSEGVLRDADPQLSTKARTSQGPGHTAQQAADLLRSDTMSWPLSILMETVLLELILQASPRDMKRLCAFPGNRGWGSRDRTGRDT